MTKPVAIVLDFDGIILESVDVKTRAFEALFADHPEHREQIVRLHVENAGMSRYEKFRRVYGELLRRPYDDEEEARLGTRFSQLVMEEILVCPHVRGAHAFLKWAAARGPVFVASATPETELREIVKRRGLAEFFTGVYGTPRAKDDILREVCRELETEPGDLVFVGDAAADCAAARTVGVPFVGRRTPGLPLPFGAGDAVLVVNDLEELRARWDEVAGWTTSPLT